MARSIHITKKDLKKERYFTSQDKDIPHCDGVSELRLQYRQKILHKINEEWRRAADKKKMPAVLHLAIKGAQVTRTIFKKRAPKPDSTMTSSGEKE